MLMDLNRKKAEEAVNSIQKKLLDMQGILLKTSEEVAELYIQLGEPAPAPCAAKEPLG